MEYITMIMSGLALLAATVCLTITLREKKRNEKRNAATLQYVDNRCDGNFNEMNQRDAEYRAFLEDRMHDIFVDLKQLKDGIVPDYQEALAAKNSVDEFNRGLSAIMGYDPMEIARKTRENRQYGGEVE